MREATNEFSVKELLEEEDDLRSLIDDCKEFDLCWIDHLFGLEDFE